jgi:ribosome-binding protein aMBF1 (putative translation factor)
MAITPKQVRKARALLGWSRPQLAARVGLNAEAIARVELGDLSLSSFDAALVAGTLETIGLEFAGREVRLRSANDRSASRGEVVLAEYDEPYDGSPV